MTEEYAILTEQPEALHSRTIRTRLPDSFGTLLYVQLGFTEWDDERNTNIAGPALCYWPQPIRPTLKLEAGARAVLVGLSESLVSDAIGARAESVHLRMLVEQPFVISLSQAAHIIQLEALLDWFNSELTDPKGKSPMTLAAYMRLIFTLSLRLHQPEQREASSEKTNILRQFRHLVELHYREHWLVSRYAEELAVDYDRLHRICKRETGRTPAELVHERLTAEAKARLERTGYPLKRISSDLGFTDATRFSHFFKRRTEMSPGAYRAIVSRPDGEDLVSLKQGFADWP